MKNPRIYQPGSYQEGDRLELDPVAGQHVGVVLRMQTGDELTLFRGDNYEFSACIEAVKKKHVQVYITKAQVISRESPVPIHLAQSISKGERMDWVVQKAVELGVSSIYPLISERCAVKLDAERMAKKWHHWQAIAIAACEQSGRNCLPIIHQPMILETYVQQSQEPLKLVLHPQGSKTWRDFDWQPHRAISLLIGPEGGLSDAEIESAINCGFAALGLGPRILRTETAAITALSLLQALAGDL